MPFVDTHELKVREPLPGWQGRYFHSEHMTFGYYEVRAGASIHEHSHPNEEVWHVLEGELEVTIGGETRVAGPGAVAIVPPHATHSVRALSAGRSIVVDHPRRESIGAARTDP
jgi:quercetin dioxygenase-like cupin family protein